MQISGSADADLLLIGDLAIANGAHETLCVAEVVTECKGVATVPQLTPTDSPRSAFGACKVVSRLLCLSGVEFMDDCIAPVVLCMRG